MKRSPLKRHTRLSPRRKTPRRSERVRDPAYIELVRALGCMATNIPGHTCEGPIEVDHMGRRPFGRKCDDTEVAGLCRRAHRERADFSGAFKHHTKAEMRRLLDGCVDAVKDILRRRAA